MNKDIKEKVFFWRDIRKTCNQIHMAFLNETTSFCGSISYDKSFPKHVVMKEPINYQNVCKNCLKISENFTVNNARDYTIQNAKKTVSKPSVKYNIKHKRLKAYQKTLNKSREDFFQAVNDYIDKNPENENPSLKESLQTIEVDLFKIRKLALENMNQITTQLQTCELSEQLQHMHNLQKIKELITAIDVLTKFQ